MYFLEGKQVLVRDKQNTNANLESLTRQDDGIMNVFEIRNNRKHGKGTYYEL